MELFGLAAWQVLLLVLGISGVISFGVVQLLKMLYASYIASTPEADREPWYWDTELRALAILLGAAVGSMFSYVGLNIVLAIGLGFAGGVLNTVIVKVIKAKLRDMKFGAAAALDDEKPCERPGQVVPPKDGVE